MDGILDPQWLHLASQAMAAGVTGIVFAGKIGHPHLK
jgi:hypothetical protein